MKNKRNKGFTFRLLACALSLMLAFGVKAQTYVTSPMTGTPAPGQYYNDVSISVIPNFNFTATAGQSLQLYIAPYCMPLGTAPSASQNYVMTSIPRLAGYNPAVTSHTVCDVMQSIQYIDGLGRPLQTVQVKASPLGYDMVQPFAYDAFGRPVTKYLSYTPQTGTAGSYRANAISTDQTAFYNAPPSNSGVSPITNPIAQTAFEASPLNRPVEQGAPGVPWQLGSHTVKMVYTLNNDTLFSADSVKGRRVSLYRAAINADQTRTITANGYYAAGTLTVTVTKDENWTSGRAGTVEEYKDNQGHVVLKRVYNYAGAVQMLSTYYVYDDFGLLAFVLPPLSGADGDANISQTTLDNLCYQYRYDERNRMGQKKLPGKGWEFTVFNTIDQPVATQDSLQRETAQWLFTKYDAMGRSVTSGIWASAPSRAALQTTLTGINSNLWEAPVNSGSGYTNVAWPTSLTTPLDINYYDTYNNIPNLPATYTVTTGISNMTRSLPTVKKTAVLNTPTDLLWDVIYYDDLGRNIKSYAQHYLGGTLNIGNYDLITTTYNFTNAPTTISRQHWNTVSATAPLATIYNKYIYDNLGRKLKTWEQIANGVAAPDTMRLISKLSYNEIGQLNKKSLHSKDSVNFLQNIIYTYNERGWLLQSSAPLFTMNLQYNTGTNKQYNGNIAYQSWTAPGISDAYTYTYDKLNRLLAGNSGGGYKENNISYDAMGNVSTLDRYQAGALIDRLSYTLYTGTNQVRTITDNSGNNAGLVNLTTTYIFDGNGNLQSSSNTVNTSQNKSFTYNLLNLPILATIPTGSVTYTYDATGGKLRKVNISAGVTTSTDYICGIEYDNSTTAIGFIQTEVGKAVPNSTSYDYQYYLSDLLGNTRITFSTKTGTPVNIQQDDYYPFGMEILRTMPVPNPKNEYLYNKKELQEELSEYDFGARFYDPIVARSTTIDPLAEISRRWSPYSYAENNPVRNIDVDGMFTQDEDGTMHFDNAEEAGNYLAGLKNYAKKVGGSDGKEEDKSDDGGKDGGKKGKTPQKKDPGISLSKEEQLRLGLRYYGGDYSGSFADNVNGVLDQWNTNLNPFVWILNAYYGLKNGTDWLGNPQSLPETDAGIILAVIPMGGELRGTVKWAFGFELEARALAKQVGGNHLMGAADFKELFLKIINDPKSEIHFSLNGIDEVKNITKMINTPGRSSTNWEMHQLYQSPAFERTIFHYGGKTYTGFEVFKIK